MKRISDKSTLTPLTQLKASFWEKEAKIIVPDVIIFEARRFKERQYYLAGKGRTKEELRHMGVPDEFLHFSDPSAKKRTWTLNSKHLSGRAFDIAFFDGKNYSWNTSQENWQKLIAIGKKYGLDNLAPTEYGHFQDNGEPLPNNLLNMFDQEVIDSINKNFKPMSKSQMRRQAANWGGDALDAFNVGSKYIKNPVDFHDFRQVIAFGRMHLEFKK